MIGVMVPSVFAEINYSQLNIESKSSFLFEMKDSKIIVTTIELTNNSNEEFSSLFGNSYHLVTSDKYFERGSYDLDIGSKVCPALESVPAGGTKEITLCFELPKNLPNSSYSIQLTDSFSLDWCDDAEFNQYSDPCQIIKKSIQSPVPTNYNDYVKKFITTIDDIKINFDSIDLIEQNGFNILKINFDVTNLSSNQISYYSSNIFAITPDNTSYSPNRYDMTNLGYSNDDCDNDSITINPKLTKSYSYCFEVPQGNTVFDLAVREGSFEDCGGWGDCSEIVLNISNPTFVPLLNEQTPSSDSNSIPSNPSDIFKEGAEKSVNFLDSLGVSGDTLFADQIIIKPYTDLKKYVDDENNFSILYPSMLTTFEEYVGGHGVKGLVAFRDEVYNTDLVYLSVFGKIPNIVGSENEILDQLEFSLLSNWNAPNTTVTILEKYAQEFNGHKHHIITLMAVEDGESVPLIYRAATSWVIVGDDLWEINSFHHHTPIRIALGFGYLTTEFLTVSEVEDIATIIMRSSDDQNVNLMTSFQKINASDNMIQKSIGIASFVDATKDPQHYIDRYNNEPTYKEWFDENYSQYSSIYEAVGLSEPVVVLESVIDYTPEPEYISEPTVEVADTSNCGAGTELVNGICKVIQTEEKSSKGGGCLIATATYGSEMAPQVQQLRELRDNQLLQTQSGTAFMGMFNDVYYTFSPIIADYERENPYFKEAVKLAITPMISSLSLMENANSESEVLGIGISVIVLNLGMYLGVPAIVVIGIRKRI